MVVHPGGVLRRAPRLGQHSLHVQIGHAPLRHGLGHGRGLHLTAPGLAVEEPGVFIRQRDGLAGNHRVAEIPAVLCHGGVDVRQIVRHESGPVGNVLLIVGHVGQEGEQAAAGDHYVVDHRAAQGQIPAGFEPEEGGAQGGVVGQIALQLGKIAAVPHALGSGLRQGGQHPVFPEGEVLGGAEQGGRQPRPHETQKADGHKPMRNPFHIDRLLRIGSR